MKEKYWIIVIVAILMLLSIVVKQQVSNISTEPEFVKAKLIKVINSSFDRYAGYYEGKLILLDIKTGKKYSIFVCSKSWDWVKENSCYKFSPKEVNENIEKHKYSAELSGCYVGTLEEISC
ncbi:MAG TPA: hypothetical protein ENF67_00930 [Candidatus Pacearchaeota archaeon]|nr:hypothetical protein [Candidatus Pacearchaeota archaeon]